MSTVASIPAENDTDQLGQVASNDTVGWQTYQDSQNGFKVEYPPGWSIEEPASAGITVRPDDESADTLGARTADLACQFILIDGIENGEYTFQTITNATAVRTSTENTGKIVFEEDNYDDNTITVRLNIDDEFVDII